MGKVVLVPTRNTCDRLLRLLSSQFLPLLVHCFRDMLLTKQFCCKQKLQISGHTFKQKSTKSHLYEVNKTLVEALIQSKGDPKSGAVLEELTKRIDGKMKGYEKEKSEIEEKATDLEKESAHEFAAHQMYSFAVACFQICIVLASVSILVDSSVLYMSSVVGGVIGVGLMIYGYVMK